MQAEAQVASEAEQMHTIIKKEKQQKAGQIRNIDQFYCWNLVTIKAVGDQGFTLR